MKVNCDEKIIENLLLKKDPTILAQLYIAYADELLCFFLNKYQTFQNDPTDLISIITDSLLKLTQSPNKFNPQLSALKTYIYNDINGDIINALGKRITQKNSVHYNVVELDSINWNIDLGDINANLDQKDLEFKMKAYFAKVFPEILDQELAWMIVIDKTRETEKFGTILNIEQKDLKEKEEIVKRTKDRINVKLKRNGFKEFLKNLRRNA